MIHKSFAVFDSKSGLYSHPFHTHNNLTALRQFESDVHRDGTPLNKYPQDFTLHEIGEYDDKSGIMKPLTAPVHIGSALDYVQR